MQRIRLAKLDANLGPAGGHFSTATDLARLLLAELNAGRLGDRQVIPAAVIDETQRAQVPQERQYQHYRRHAWGLGWDIGTVEGDTVVHRPGGFNGYYANAAFMPHHGFGLAVLSNGGSAGARVAEAVAGAIYDELRGRDGALEQLDAKLDSLETAVEGRAGQLTRLMDSLDPPGTLPRAIEAYVGSYGDDLWGKIEIEADGNVLTLRSGTASGSLRPVTGSEGVFFVQLFDSDDQVTFDFGGSDVARSVSIRSTPATFVRRE